MALPTVQGTNLTIDGQRFRLDIEIGGVAVGSIAGKAGDPDSGSLDVARDMVQRYKRATQGPRARVGNSDMECELRLNVLSIVASAACCENPSDARLARNAETY